VREETPRPRLLSALPLVAFAGLAVVLVRCAWQCDDGYITFRTVWNWVHGYGLRWNPIERVQAYTHPLWMLAATACLLVSGDVYYSTIGLSIALTLLAVFVLYRAAPSPAYALLTILFFGASSAAVDFAASGLETPLLVLLLALFVLVLEREPASPRTLLLALLVSLIGLTRLDALLLVLPALAVRAWGQWSRATALRLCLGAVPLGLWHAFSLFYYGFLFPNTAYAKLGRHAPLAEVLLRGIVYLSDSLRHDPVTLLVVLAGIRTAAVHDKRTARGLGAGVALYLLYVISIGGDFMSGRFLVAPFVVALALLGSDPLWRGVRPAAIAGATALVIALILPDSRMLSGAEYGRGDPLSHIRDTGIGDERAYYYPSTGLLNVWRRRHELAAVGAPVPPHAWAIAGAKARADNVKAMPVPEVGFFGYFAGPGVHIVDLFALADPLLARLPFDPSIAYRVGHYVRRLPEGYGRSVVGENQIVDPRVKNYYEVIRLITRGPLLSAARLRAIVRMQLGLGPSPPPPDYH
jgi:arabinofuranosyltransferase